MRQILAESMGDGHETDKFGGNQRLNLEVVDCDCWDYGFDEVFLEDEVKDIQ